MRSVILALFLGHFAISDLWPIFALHPTALKKTLHGMGNPVYTLPVGHCCVRNAGS